MRSRRSPGTGSIWSKTPNRNVIEPSSLVRRRGCPDAAQYEPDRRWRSRSPNAGIAGYSYHSSLDTPPSSLVFSVVDASVRQSDHVAGNPNVEHHRCGILQELSGSGAELIHAAHKPAAAAKGPAHGAQVRRSYGREVGFHLVRIKLVVFRTQRQVVQAHHQQRHAVAYRGLELPDVHHHAGIAVTQHVRLVTARRDRPYRRRQHLPDAAEEMPRQQQAAWLIEQHVRETRGGAAARDHADFGG